MKEHFFSFSLAIHLTKTHFEILIFLHDRDRIKRQEKFLRLPDKSGEIQVQRAQGWIYIFIV